MENDKKLKTIIEALLIVSENGLTKKELKEAIPEAEARDIGAAVEKMREDYSAEDRAFNIAEIAGKYRIVTKPEYMPWIVNLYQKEAERITGPSLETLAIIAYKQPITRAEVELIRGVNVGGVMKTLLDKGLLELRGRKEVIGRPLLYGTSRRFLEIFGLNSLEDLPALREFVEDDLDYGKPQEVVENEGEVEEQPVSEEPVGAASGREPEGDAGEVSDREPQPQEETVNEEERPE